MTTFDFFRGNEKIWQWACTEAGLLASTLLQDVARILSESCLFSNYIDEGTGRPTDQQFIHPQGKFKGYNHLTWKCQKNGGPKIHVYRLIYHVANYVLHSMFLQVTDGIEFSLFTSHFLPGDQLHWYHFQTTFVTLQPNLNVCLSPAV